MYGTIQIHKSSSWQNRLPNFQSTSIKVHKLIYIYIYILFLFFCTYQNYLTYLMHVIFQAAHSN